LRNHLSRNHLLIINGAILTACAVFDYAWRTTILTGLMLILPFVDSSFTLPQLNINAKKLIRWLICILLMYILVTIEKDYKLVALSTLLLIALPEEWFFRGYFMRRIEKSGLHPCHANIITSVFFALLHLPTQGLWGLSVFIPSMIYGWIFQKYNDIVIVILLHGLSNLIFIIYIKHYLNM